MPVLKDPCKPEQKCPLDEVPRKRPRTSEQQSWKVDNAKNFFERMSTFANRTEWDPSTDDNLVEYYLPIGKYHLRKLEAYTPTPDDNTSELNLLKQQYQTTVAVLAKKDLLYNKSLSNEVKQLLALTDCTDSFKASSVDYLVPLLEKKLKRFDEVLQSSKYEGDEHNTLQNLRDHYKAQLECLHDLKPDLSLTAASNPTEGTTAAIGGSCKRARS